MSETTYRTKQGYSEEQLAEIAKQRNIPDTLINIAIKFGLIKPKYTMYDYIEEATAPGKPGYETIVIWGVQGAGKSNLLLQTGFWTYYKKGKISPSEAWNAVLQNLLFTPSQFIEKLKKIPKDIRIPWLGWDDIGVHYSYMAFRTDVKIYEGIGQAWHAIRTKADVTVLTIPVIDDLPANLKRNVTIEVFIGRNQLVEIRRWFRLPSLRPNQDSFLVRLPIEPLHRIELYDVPSEVFARYWNMRLELADKAISELEKVKEEVREWKPPTVNEWYDILRSAGIRGGNEKFAAAYKKIFGKDSVLWRKHKSYNNNMIKEGVGND